MDSPMTSLFFQKLGQGPPMLILPGLLGTGDNWLTIAKELAMQYTLYLVDHRNHGRSFHHAVMTYEAMTEDLSYLMIQEGIVNPILIGHSMGGKVGMEFAQTYPQAVAKLIVVDIAPRAYEMSNFAVILQALQKISLQSVRNRAEVDMRLSSKIPDSLLRNYLMKNLCRDSQGMLLWRSNIPALAANIPNLEQEITCKAPFMKPTLFVSAEQSDYIQEQDLPKIKAIFPNYLHVPIKNAGHWVNYYQPVRLLQTIAQFLES
jgi:esterase